MSAVGAGASAPRWRTWVALAGGVLIVSTAAILIREAQAAGVPSLAIAAWRLVGAALLLAPFVLALRRAELAALPARDHWLGMASGLFLALHFATWIASLEYTSVASSVALVTTNPIWIALFSFLVLRERLPVARVIAVAVAIAGSLIVLVDDGSSAATHAPRPALGNALAIGGALAVCGYLLIGRRLRAHVSLLAYVGIVYAVAGAALIVAALASGVPLWGYSAGAWILLAALALGPQLLGHGAVNYALKEVSPTVIALAVLGEPIGAALLAWLLMGEGIGPVKLCGLALLLAGIFLAARSESRAPAPA
ncbi:MAG: DMT family transporter [Burkholderiales bacterium]|nr:DMT family transporter [Burkholderiales bacterium]